MTLDFGPDVLVGNNVQPASASDQSVSKLTLGLGLRLRFVLPLGLTLAGRGRASLLGGHDESIKCGDLGFRWLTTKNEFEVGVEAGQHSVSSLAERGLLTTVISDPGVDLPFVGAFAAWTPLRRSIMGVGISAFLGRDIGSQVTHVSWGGVWAGGSQDHRIGGWFGGASAHVVFGEATDTSK